MKKGCFFTLHIKNVCFADKLINKMFYIGSASDKVKTIYYRWENYTEEIRQLKLGPNIQALDCSFIKWIGFNEFNHITTRCDQKAFFICFRNKGITKKQRKMKL